MRAALVSVLLPVAAAQEAAGWKYKYLAVVVQNSGAHRGPNALALTELLNRLAAIKPAGASVGLFGFDQEFRQLAEGRFTRKATRLLADTTSAQAIREAVAELVFHGPSPVYDTLVEALEPAAKTPEAAVLLISNGVDNASDVSFDELTKRIEKTGVPLLAFYFPTNPTLGGDSRMRKLAKVSGGRFIDVRLKDSWEQLVATLR